MIFTYQNRQSSLYNKTNTKEKKNYIVANYKAPPSNIQANRSIYTTIRVGNTEPAKYSRVLVAPQRNPIKHYRRELIHDSYKKGESRQIINNINMPGKTIVSNILTNDGFYPMCTSGYNLNNWTQNQTIDVNNGWNSIALNSDGTKILVTNFGDSLDPSGGKIHQSTDSGVTWSDISSSPIKNWTDIACSDDGSTIAAIAVAPTPPNYPYISTDNGYTWNNPTSSFTGSEQWSCIAMSANGTNIAVAGYNIINNDISYNTNIYISRDSGSSFTPHGPNQHWTGVTINASGSHFAACTNNDVIYTSTDSGFSWSGTTSGSKRWTSISMNSTGNQIVAGAFSLLPSEGDFVYISTDYGENWAKTGSPPTTSSWAVSTSGDGSIIVASTYDKIYISYSFTNFNNWIQVLEVLDLDNWFDIKISRSGNVAYALRSLDTYIAQLWYSLTYFEDHTNPSNQNLFKDEIYPNNEICYNNCNKQNNVIKSGNTNISEYERLLLNKSEYSSSMSSLRYRRGQTYENNIYNTNQKIIKNSSSCNNNNQEFITNKKPSTNGSTSISSYRRQYGQHYNENVNILNNSTCCNNIELKISNLTICDPHIYPNLIEKKNIC